MSRVIPIIFSAPMVEALLARRKHMTRRLFKRDREPPPGWNGLYGFSVLTPERHVELRGHDPKVGPISRFMRLRITKGDRLWVRETWQTAMSDAGPCVCYRAGNHRWHPPFTGPNEGRGPSFDYRRYPGTYAAAAGDVEANDRPWRSPMHMPRWASRLTLEVTGVKVERLHEIPLTDVRAEGCEVRDFWLFGARDDQRQKIGATVFRRVWEEIHGDGSWNDNPEVVALSFRVTLANVDGSVRTHSKMEVAS